MFIVPDLACVSMCRLTYHSLLAGLALHNSGKGVAIALVANWLKPAVVLFHDLLNPIEKIFVDDRFPYCGRFVLFSPMSVSLNANYASGGE